MPTGKADRKDPEEAGFRLLVLGGTREARLLVTGLDRLVQAGDPRCSGLSLITSLAGRTEKPLALPGQVRSGGFGGVAGLIRTLRQERISALVDATHPFAARMTGNAWAACQETGIPCLRLERPGWLEENSRNRFTEQRPGHRFRGSGRYRGAVGRRDALLHPVADMRAARDSLPRGARVFLATGRQALDSFSGRSDVRFLMRALSRPPVPRGLRGKLLCARPGRGIYAEMALMRAHRITLVVTRDSGGDDAKLAAARRLGLPVIAVQRPPSPPMRGVKEVTAAMDWVLETLEQAGPQTGGQIVDPCIGRADYPSGSSGG